MTGKLECGPDSRSLKLLLVGALPPPIGGLAMLFQYLVEDLSSRDDVEISIVNISCTEEAGWRKLFSRLQLFWQIAVRAMSVDVIALHTGTSSLHLSGPAVALAGWISGRPIIIRKGAGTDYRTYGRLRVGLIRWALCRADLYLVETKALVEAAREDGVGRVEWHPNSRPMVPTEALPGPRSDVCRRFIFLGHVKRTKGVGEIVQAAERFESGVTVDVYGPFFDDFSEDTFSGLRNTIYRGVVPGGEAISVLREYDALLLPTYHVGEGLPGVLVEAFSAGIPVICTYWMCLPEIVDGTTGILIEPRDADALYDAMRRLSGDRALYARLCEGVRKKREEFSSKVWTERFVEYCREATKR